jgi:hypothetical protein
MSDERHQEFEDAAAALARVTAEAKELMQRLSADLEQQTREQDAHRLDAAARREDER